MRRTLLLTIALFVAGLCVRCGPAPLEGVAFNEIQLEGDEADAVKAALGKALSSAGVTFNEPDAPNLVGEVTWEWAGEGDHRYPTQVEINLHSDPASDDSMEAWARWAVEKGGQPQDVARYSAAIADRVVSVFSAQLRDAES
jgi:hypothetical protein